RTGGRTHFDAVHRACGNAQLAAGAQRRHHRVHQLAGTDDRIDRTGLDAFRAADAVRLDDDGELWRAVHAATAVIGQRGDVEQARQDARARIAAGRAAIDARLPARHRLGIRPAAFETALPALGLRQQPVEALD